MLVGYSSPGGIKIRDPNLRSVFFGRNKGKPLSIPRPSWPVRILIRNNLPLPTGLIDNGVPHVSLILGNVGIVVLIATKRSEEHTSELQSHSDLVCRLLLEKKKKNNNNYLRICY